MYGWGAGGVWEGMTDAITEISQITRMLNAILRNLNFIVETGKWWRILSRNGIMCTS